MTNANASALFTGLKRAESFNKKIHIADGDEEDRYLRSCRKKIRSALRKQFLGFATVFADDATRMLLNERRDENFNKRMRGINSVEIRFLTQGSHAYKTLIRPANPEHQEIDLDDGVYFPMPFVEGRPLFASAGLFSIVRAALEPVVEAEGWTFGKRRDTCIRIKLPLHNAHIDLPLFAVDESAFSIIQKNLEDRLGAGYRNIILNDALSEYGLRDQRLSTAQILLAHRVDDWFPSDPKVIHDWFESKVRTHGHVLRRICRYLKAWRDRTWNTGGPSSIALMALAVAILDVLEGKAEENRDDLLTQIVSQHLPDGIRRGNITGPSDLPAFDSEWTEREQYAAYAEKLAEGLSKALFDETEKQGVVDRLIEQFGGRFPNAAEAVSLDLSAQIDALTDVAPATVAAPIVNNSTSG